MTQDREGSVLHTGRATRLKSRKVKCVVDYREGGVEEGSQVAEPTPWSRRSVAGGPSRGSHNFLFWELRANIIMTKITVGLHEHNKVNGG